VKWCTIHHLAEDFTTTALNIKAGVVLFVRVRATKHTVELQLTVPLKLICISSFNVPSFHD
jgi:hypothetical protein